MKEKKIRNKDKYDSFGDFVLNDREIVMPFLMMTSLVFSIVIFGFMTFIAFYYELDLFFKVLFGLMLFASLYKMYKNYKFGGWRALKKVKLNANEVVWNKYETENKK